MAEIIFDDLTLTFPLLGKPSRGLAQSGGTQSSENEPRHIEKGFTALKNLSFTFRDGDKVAVLGANGAGKTTFLRTLAGVYKEQSGRRELSGTIGSLIEIGLGLNPEATGRENVYLRGRLLGMGKRQLESKFSEIVEFAELGNFIDLPIRTYSSGMNLRLAFAVSTLLEADIILMDEWLSIGDEKFTHKAEKRLSEMLSKSRILVLATHSRSLAEHVCNRAIWLDRGEIKMDGPVEEVSKAYFG
jgi:lipopolysaccharide transport system ATP-binding protein